MTSREFDELIAFWHLEPFGDIREDARAKMIAQTVANFTPGIKKAFKRNDKIFQVIDEGRAVRESVPLSTRWQTFVRLHNQAVKNGNDSESSS